MCNCSADEVATKASSSERVAIISIYSSPINIVFWKLNWPKILKYDAQQSCQHCLAEISIQSQLTFELRFFADLSSGLTKSASSTGIEERTGDSSNFGTWNKTVYNTTVKECLKAGTGCHLFRKIETISDDDNINSGQRILTSGHYFTWENSGQTLCDPF